MALAGGGKQVKYGTSQKTIDDHGLLKDFDEYEKNISTAKSLFYH